MPALWLLLPFAAAALYFSLPAAARTARYDDAGSADGLALGPVEDAGADNAANILGDVRDFIMNLPNKIFSLPASAAPYAEPIATAEEKYGLPESLLGRLLYQESHFRPDIISGQKVSSAGALGIAQFMPDTAADLGVDPLNAHQSIDAAARYLRSLYDRLGAWAPALAAYNWGIGNVQRKGLSAAPAETKTYVASIMNDVGL